MWILIFVLITLTCNLVTADIKDHNARFKKPLGRFMCPQDHVLTIYDDQYPYALYMACMKPTVCNKQLPCRKRTCSRWSQKQLSFLHELKEKNKFDRLNKRCCNYWPRPREYEETNCFSLKITDKLFDRVIPRRLPKGLRPFFPKRPRKPKPKRPKGKGDGGKKGATPPPPPKDGDGEPRTNPDVLTKGLAHVFLHKVPERPMEILTVSSIDRIENGYKITACHIRCKNDDEDEVRERVNPRKRKTKGNRVKPEYEDPLPEKKKVRRPMRQRRPKRPRGRRVKPKAKGPTPKPTINLGTFDTGISLPDLSCFPGDSQVMTLTGKKRMDQLDTHDQVLVSSILNGGPIYQPIDIWYHRISNKSTKFIILKTDHDTLSLSPNHLVPIFDCEKIKELRSDVLGSLVATESKFAFRAKRGQCLIQLQETHFVGQPIIEVQKEWKTGIYSPITAQGTLVVNGFHVSCFTTFENHWAQHSIHVGLMHLYRVLKYITGSEFVHTDIPLPMKLLIEIANLVLPESMF